MYTLCAEDMKIFYGLSKGAIEPIGILFSELAGSPMPPAVIMQVLTIISAQTPNRNSVFMQVLCITEYEAEGPLSPHQIPNP